MTLVPEEKQGELLFLKSELHYLQVVTERGTTLILYNLSDAILQIPAEVGMSIHRSYWVSFNAIKQLTRKGRQGTLHLKDGQTLPVSRNRLKDVSANLQDR